MLLLVGGYELGRGDRIEVSAGTGRLFDAHLRVLYARLQLMDIDGASAAMNAIESYDYNILNRSQPAREPCAGK